LVQAGIWSLQSLDTSVPGHIGAYCLTVTIMFTVNLTITLLTQVQLTALQRTTTD